MSGSCPQGFCVPQAVTRRSLSAPSPSAIFPPCAAFLCTALRSPRYAQVYPLQGRAPQPASCTPPASVSGHGVGQPGLQGRTEGSGAACYSVNLSTSCEPLGPQFSHLLWREGSISRPSPAQSTVGRPGGGTCPEGADPEEALGRSWGPSLSTQLSGQQACPRRALVRKFSGSHAASHSTDAGLYLWRSHQAVSRGNTNRRLFWPFTRNRLRLGQTA